MKYSKCADIVEPSLTRQLFNMAKQYDDVIDLTLGDPDIQPNYIIKKAACDAIMAGKTRYSANAGLIELRKKINSCLHSEYNIVMSPLDNIIVTVGGMEALYLTFLSIIDKGDEVIIQAPYYINYVQMIRMCGGKPIIVNTSEDNNFEITGAEIRKKISDKTVAIVVNSPNNPTGSIVGQKNMDDIAKIACEYDLYVISDEVYKTILYDSRKHDSIITRPGMLDRTILVDSISKRFSMTGYRIGYAAGPKKVIENMVKLQENVCACAPLPSQYAAIAAYQYLKDDKTICNIFEERRNFFANAINKIDGLHCVIPDGTFYLFVNISRTGKNCLDFAYDLLKQKHVAVVPAIAYGETYTNYVRIAFTLEMSKLKEAVERISDFMKLLIE